MNPLASWLLPLIVFTPLVGAALLLFLPKGEAGQHKIVALCTSAIVFAISLGLLAFFEPGVAGFQESMTVNAEWIPSLGIRFHMAIDGISLFLILLTTWLMPIVVLSTFTAVEGRTKEFYLAMLVLETAMLGAFVAVDMILFYVFWEVMLIPMYILIGVFGGPRRIYSAIKFFIYTMVGSLLMLLAILFLYFDTSSFDFQTLLDANLSLYEQRWLFWAFVLAFAVKVPLFPFHTWLPDAHVEAPTAGSVILAGVLLKMGSYGLMRFAFPLFPEAAAIYAPVIAFISVVGIVYGAFMAMAQSDVKKLIAYSSVSHMGFVILGLTVLTTSAGTGAVYQMLNHGVSSGALFLLVGIIYERRHTREMADFGGIAKVMPAYAAFFMLVALSSAGLPGTNGFVGEFLILLGSFTSAPAWGRWAAGIGGTGVIFGAVYLLWMYRRVFFGPLTNSKNEKLKDLTLREWVTLVPIAGMILFMGLYPKPFLDRITPSVEAYVGRVLSVATEGKTGGVATANAEVGKALGAGEGEVVLLGPGGRALGAGNELNRVLASARAWQGGGAAPVQAVPPPAAGRMVPAGTVVAPAAGTRVGSPRIVPRQNLDGRGVPERPRPAEPQDAARRLRLQKQQLDILRKRAQEMGLKAPTAQPVQKEETR
ncbi:MAG: NADH-quinone oxidoreductase subunit M [Deltaproteobacteria bacterium]|nr:NADH-quinone oxidoreductase subunit M [Deltaproteobacteria bacterium]